MKDLIYTLAHYCSRLLSDKLYLQLKFRHYFGRWINFKNPTSFNEKMQWLKVYDRKHEYTRMVDKYEVRQYIAECVGAQYLVPLLGVWNSADDIDFDSLPNEFVLKCTHDSGGIIICRDKRKLDIPAIRKKLNKALSRKFYYYSREWPYKNVTPRIISEALLYDEEDPDLKDYKFMCFEGVHKCTFVCSNRHSYGLNITIYDSEWKRMPVVRHHPPSKSELRRPDNYQEMRDIAELLSRNMHFLRVDFYECNSRLYVGELTFYPGGGFEEFTPSEWDEKLGSWIKLK